MRLLEASTLVPCAANRQRRALRHLPHQRQKHCYGSTVSNAAGRPQDSNGQSADFKLAPQKRWADQWISLEDECRAVNDSNGCWVKPVRTVPNRFAVQKTRTDPAPVRVCSNRRLAGAARKNWQNRTTGSTEKNLVKF